MADEEVTSTAQVAETVEAQVAETSSNEAAASTTGLTEREYEKLLKEVRSANAEAAKYRVELKQVREALAAKEAAEVEARTQAERANMSEIERIRAEKADAEAKAQAKQQEYEDKLKARELAIRDSALRAAVQATKVVDADAAERLLDWNRVEYDERGKPTNLEELLGELVKERPWLIGTTSQVSPTNAAAQPKSGDRTVFRASEVTYDMWRTQRPILMKAIAEGRWVQDE